MAGQDLRTFKATSDHLVGVDSDGTVFDAMDIKHYECFVPAFIEVWNLQPVFRAARETWLFANLRGKHRGINRWAALELVLRMLRERADCQDSLDKLPPVEELDALAAFLTSGAPHSRAGVEQYMADHPSPAFEKALVWDRQVNDRCATMVRDVPVFPGAARGLEAISKRCDVAVISAASSASLEREWSEHDLERFTVAMAGQEHGNKAEQLETAMRDRYPRERTLMVGDAPGDLNSARTAGCFFFPIIPGQEAACWDRLVNEGIERFLADEYAGSYQDELIAEYTTALNAAPPWETV